jgi:hypothetical protein
MAAKATANKTTMKKYTSLLTIPMAMAKRHYITPRIA